MVGAGTCNIIKSHTPSPGSATHKLENSLYHRSSPTGMRVLEPMSGSQAWGSGIGRSETPEHLASKAVRFEWRNSTELGKTETSLLEGLSKISCTLGHNYLQVLEDLLGRRGWGGSCDLFWDKDTGGAHTEEHSSAWALLEANILVLRLGPTQQPAGPSTRTSQAKQPAGWEHSRQAASRPPEPTAVPRHTPWHSPAHPGQGPAPPASVEALLLPLGTLNKPPDQPHSPGGWQFSCHKQENWLYILQKWIHKCRSEPTPRPAGLWPLSNRSRVTCWDIGCPLQRATSPRSRNITDIPHP